MWPIVHICTCRDCGTTNIRAFDDAIFWRYKENVGRHFYRVDHKRAWIAVHVTEKNGVCEGHG